MRSLSTLTSSFNNTAWFGWSIALLNVLFFSIAAPLMTIILKTGVDPTTLVTLRYILTTLLLGGTLVVTAPERLRIDRKGLLTCALAGLLFGTSFFLFALSLTRISTSIATMIAATAPLMVLLILATRGEPLTLRNITRLILGLVGVYFLIGVTGQVDLLGVGLILMTALTYAFYVVIIQALKDYDSQTVLIYIFGATMLFAMGLWAFQGGTSLQLSGRAWIAMGALVILATYVAQLCLFIAIRHIGGGQMALLNPVEVFLTVFWAILFLGDRLTPEQWLGGGLILASMVLAIKRIGRKAF
ncbi:MAG: DMT family transporter [Chloroflexota bacterium]